MPTRSAAPPFPTALVRAILVEEICPWCREMYANAPCSNCPVQNLAYPIRTRRTDPRIQQIVGYIHRRFADPLRVSDLASRIGLGVSRLERLFRREKGMSIKAYVHRLRLEKARLLLIGTEQRVSEIAYATGWNDPANFSNAFRKLYGQSPTGFRRSRRLCRITGRDAHGTAA